MKDSPIATCPKQLCQQKTWGKGKVKRQVGTGAGLIFKGSGFYITDYRSEGYKQAAKNEAAPAAKQESSAAAGSKPAESKPAETKAAAPAKAPPAKSSTPAQE